MQSNASPASNQGAPTSPFAQTTAPGTNGAAKPKMETETDSETAIKSKQELLQTASKHLYEGLKALIEATAMETQEVSKTISAPKEDKSELATSEDKVASGAPVQEPVKTAPEGIKVEPSPQPQSPSILPFAPATPKAEETEKPAEAETAATPAATASPFTASFSGKTEEKPFVPPSALIPANPPAEKPEAAAPTMQIPPFSMATPAPEAPVESPAAPTSSSPFAPVKKAEEGTPAETPAAPASSSPFAPVEKAEEAAPAGEAASSIPQLPVFGAPTTRPQAPTAPAGQSTEEAPGAFPQLPPSPFTISAGASQPAAEAQEPADKPASPSPFTAPTSLPTGASPFAPVMPTPGEENNSAPANPENSPFKAPAASPFQETLPASGDSKS